MIMLVAGAASVPAIGAAQDSGGGTAGDAIGGAENGASPDKGSSADSRAGHLRGAYSSFIGSDDHYNSRGQRLTKSWQIVRQDRANYHRFGIRDPGDEDDPFFGSLNGRARMERMLVIDPQTARTIVEENVSVRVEIYDDMIKVTLN